MNRKLLVVYAEYHDMCTCVCGKIVFKFIFRGITVTIAILNETILTFIGFFSPFQSRKRRRFS